MPPKKSASIDEPLTERRFCELLDLKLETILESKLKSIIGPLVTKIQELESKYCDLLEVCNKLKVAQASQLANSERLEVSARSKNIVVTGLQEDGNTKEEIQEIINIVTSTSSSTAATSNFEFKRLGSHNSRPGPRPIQVVLTSDEISSLAKKNAKLLRQYQKFNNVYVNPDLPPTTRKENARLRQRAKEIRLQNPTATVYIRKGMLFHNSNKIDSFNLANQLNVSADSSRTH